MDNYIDKQLSGAKELLESGVQFGRPELINKARIAFSQIKGMTKDSEKYWPLVRENMIRACSALCIYDPRNAVNYLDEATLYDKNNPVILNNYGFIYHTQYGNWDKSIQNYEKCLLTDPTYVMAYLGIIDVYRSLRHHKLELEYCKKAVSNCEKSPEIWNSYGLAMLHNHDYKNMEKIFDCFNRAIEHEPKPETLSKIYVNIGHLHGVLGDFSIAVHYYLKAIETDPKHHPAYQNILLNLHYYSDLDFQDSNLSAIMRRFDVTRKREPMSEIIDKLHVSITEAMYGSTFPNPPKLVNGTIDRKIKIGYVTSDLVDHAVSFFAMALFNHYTKEGFDVYIYSNNIYDAGSVAKVPCTEYKCIKNLSAPDCAQLIKNDVIDILVDLSGHTSGNRLDVIALRPAPIILSYLGYPDDTGFPFMRRISDKYTEIGNKSVYENGIVTAPVRLPRLFLTYTTEDVKKYEKSVKSYEGFNAKKMVTFGCFAKLQKINKHVIDVWKYILQRVPHSRIVLKSRYFNHEPTMKLWREKFGQYKDRVTLLKGTDTAEQHMELYKLIDIHLDTFPYSGTTITTESLFMNVPVVTLAIPQKVGHVQRVSGSILSSMGLEKLCVARDVREYVEKAVQLVKELPKLPSVRTKFLKSEISQHKEFMSQYESALSDIFMDAKWAQEKEDAKVHNNV